MLTPQKSTYFYIFQWQNGVKMVYGNFDGVQIKTIK